MAVGRMVLEDLQGHAERHEGFVGKLRAGALLVGTAFALVMIPHEDNFDLVIADCPNARRACRSR
jgi:hypothetical protein